MSRQFAALVVCLVVLAYAPSFGGGWLWCDEYTVVGSVTSGPPGDLELGPAPTTEREFEQFYPVTDAVHAAWLRLFGESALAFRALTFAFHAAATVLLGALAVRLALPGAWLAAALFGLHPLAVESAAWVYELKNPLSLTIALASFHAWLAFEKGRRPAATLALSLALFSLALLAKSAMVVLPVFFVLAGAIPGRRLSRQHVMALVPFAILAIAMAATTIANEPPLDAGAAPAGWIERCAVAGHAFWFYAGKVVFPIRLSFAYPRLDPASASLLPAIAAGLALAAAAVVAVRGSGRPRCAGLAVLGFGAALLPVLGFFDIYMMRYTFVADHLAYPALAATALAAGAVLASSLPARRAAALAIVLSFCALTASRAATFRSNDALWREAARREPRAWLAQLEVGLVEKSLGRDADAIERFQLSLKEHESVDALVNWGNTLVAAGRAEEAMAPLARAIELAPEDAANHANLALALVAVGRVDEAIAAFRLALTFAPDNSLLRRNLEALEEAKRVIEEGTPR